MTKTQKGAVIGTAGGAAVGAVIGKAAGNTAMGAIVGAAVGGVTGTIIGKKMDKQAEEMKKQVPGAKVERVGEGIEIEFNDKVLFGFDRSDLTSASTRSLNELINILKKYPDKDIESFKPVERAVGGCFLTETMWAYGITRMVCGSDWESNNIDVEVACLINIGGIAQKFTKF